MLLFALFLVLLNGFFVLAEFALVKVRETRLNELVEQGNRSAKAARHVVQHLDAYLSATQLGITLASLGLGWLGEPAIARLITPLIGDDLFAHTIAGVLAFLIITFFHIVIGELAPKSLAIQRPESSALGTAKPLQFFYTIFFPAIWALNGAANWLLRLIGLHPATEADLAHSEEELRMIVSASHERGILDELERDLLDNVFDFAERVAREVMIPRQDMSVIYLDDTIEDIQRLVREEPHTRYPVCDEDRDHVVGMVHIRDLWPIMSGNSQLTIRDVLHDIPLVPEGISIAQLLKEMQKGRKHMAVVIDEYGGTSGLITLEDILEEIVGDIHDEFDVVRPDIEQVSEGAVELDGSLLLEDVAEELNIPDLDEIEEVDTIGGFVFERLGRAPSVGDKVVLGNHIFEVCEIDGLRIKRVRIYLKPDRLEPTIADQTPSANP